MEQSNKENEIKITTYDRLLRGWENSMEMVRDFEMHSKTIDNDEIREIFKKFADEEGMHASKFRELLTKYKDN